MQDSTEITVLRDSHALQNQLMLINRCASLMTVKHSDLGIHSVQQCRWAHANYEIDRKQLHTPRSYIYVTRKVCRTHRPTRAGSRRQTPIDTFIQACVMLYVHVSTDAFIQSCVCVCCVWCIARII